MALSKKNKIHFHFISSTFYFPERTRLKKFILQLFRKEGYAVETVNYIFCTDAFLIELNTLYLGHNSYTDILTFLISDKSIPVMADIYVSVERVKENAQIFNTGFLMELHRVIFHGALHICGYMDKTASQTKKMRFKEDEYLRRYFSREIKHTKS